MRFRLFYICVVFLLFVLLAACRSTGKADMKTVQDSTLTQQARERIAQKKKLDEMRLQLSRSRMGRNIAKYEPIIKKYSKRYGFDWRLITAQIVQESGFRIKARSRVGASGLMQLMPGTAREISKELDIEYIMRNPRENITAGIYHLKKQYRLFPEAAYAERMKLSLASYNCGVGHIFDAQNLARYYKISPNIWPGVRPYLAMLKKSDWQLHLQIWPTGQPRFGYFYGYNETIGYVESIWNLYLAYQKIM